MKEYKEKKPLVSIIILNYNGCNYLKQSILPLLNLTYKNLEYILVDNNSNDESVDYVSQYNQIKILKNNKNLGYSKAKNLGISFSNGEYIFLLDNDVLVQNPDLIQDLLYSYEKIDFFGISNILLIDKEHEGVGLTKQYGSYYGLFGIKENKFKNIKFLESFNFPIRTVVCFGAVMFFRRDLWIKVGGLDESQMFNCDDDDISTRVSVLGYKNFTYCKSHCIHIGIENRKNNKAFAWKYKYFFSGKARSIVKNFQIHTILYMLPLFFIKSLIKTFKQTLWRKDINLIYSFIYSNFLFIKNISDTFKNRSLIQAERMVLDKNIINIQFPQEND